MGYTNSVFRTAIFWMLLAYVTVQGCSYFPYESGSHFSEPLCFVGSKQLCPQISPCPRSSSECGSYDRNSYASDSCSKIDCSGTISCPSSCSGTNPPSTPKSYQQPPCGSPSRQSSSSQSCSTTPTYFSNSPSRNGLYDPFIHCCSPPTVPGCHFPSSLCSVDLSPCPPPSPPNCVPTLSRYPSFVPATHPTSCSSGCNPPQNSDPSCLSKGGSGLRPNICACDSSNPEHTSYICPKQPSSTCCNGSYSSLSESPSRPRAGESGASRSMDPSSTSHARPTQAKLSGYKYPPPMLPTHFHICNTDGSHNSVKNADGSHNQVGYCSLSSGTCPLACKHGSSFIGEKQPRTLIFCDPSGTPTQVCCLSPNGLYVCGSTTEPSDQQLCACDSDTDLCLKPPASPCETQPTICHHQTPTCPSSICPPQTPSCPAQTCSYPPQTPSCPAKPSACPPSQTPGTSSGTLHPEAALVDCSGNEEGGNRISSCYNILTGPSSTDCSSNQNTCMVNACGNGCGGNHISSNVNCIFEGSMVKNSGNCKGGNCIKSCVNIIGGNADQVMNNEGFWKSMCNVLIGTGCQNYTGHPSGVMVVCPSPI